MCVVRKTEEKQNKGEGRCFAKPESIPESPNQDR